MMESIIGFIQYTLGVSRGTACEIIEMLVGFGFALVIYDISNSLRVIAQNKNERK